jgi:signal transduction histidine kinase
VIAIAVDHERVTAERRSSQQELRRSRERIVRAGDHERRRIARNLHDGLQVRLVLLALQAQQIAEDPDTPPAARDAAVALRVGVDAAAAELRGLVHAVLPAALIERGLSAATEDLVDHLPIPTTLEMTLAEDGLSPVVESTAYFVVAEALTNALKHASPTSLVVRLARVEDHLRVEVTDDGIGGASVRAGTGLGGLVDRVETLGGRLELSSPPEQGTRLVAELPCAS